MRDLKAHQSVILPLIGRHGGRIIDTAGDGIMAEFHAFTASSPSAPLQTLAALFMKRLCRNRGRTGDAANGAPHRAERRTSQPPPEIYREAAADTVSNNRMSWSERARWGCSRRQAPPVPARTDHWRIAGLESWRSSRLRFEGWEVELELIQQFHATLNAVRPRPVKRS